MVSEANRERTRERTREQTAKPAALASRVTSRVTSPTSLNGEEAARRLMLIETFRFEDKNDYEYEIWFKVFSLIVKK